MPRLILGAGKGALTPFLGAAFVRELAAAGANVAVLSRAADDAAPLILSSHSFDGRIDNPAALREMADQFRDRIKSGIVVLGSRAGAKALLIALVSKDLVKRYHAGNIITEVAAVVGGRGGGRPDMAQAGGNQPQKLDQALEKAYEVVGQIEKDEGRRTKDE